MQRPLGREGEPLGEQSVEEDAQRIEIGGRGDHPPLEHLRRHVGRGPRHAPLAVRRGAAQWAGDAEVEQLGLTAGQHVGWLHVAMDDPSPVHVLEHRQQADRQRKRLPGREMIQVLGHRPAGEVGHHQGRPADDLPVADGPRDPRVLEAMEDRVLALELVGVAELGGHLDRHLAVFRVRAGVDGRHRARAKDVSKLEGPEANRRGLIGVGELFAGAGAPQRARALGIRRRHQRILACISDDGGVSDSMRPHEGGRSESADGRARRPRSGRVAATAKSQ